LWILVLWAAFVLSILPRPVWAEGPRDEVNAAIDRLLAARSFVATFTDGAGRVEHQLEYESPGRYRIRSGGHEQVIIGDVLYSRQGGQRVQAPVPQGVLTRWRDPARLAEHAERMEVVALASEPVGGLPARKYRIVQPGPAPRTLLLWIGPDGLPLQIGLPAGTGQAATTIRYARINDPGVRVAPPA